MGWLIALAVVVFLAMLPLGVCLRYDARGAMARMIVGPVRVQLYPRKKAKKTGAKKKEQKKSTASSPDSGKTEKQGGSLTDFYPLLQAIGDFLSELRRKIRVNRLQMKLILAGNDPCDLAVNYGKAWAILSGLMPQLERFFVINQRDVGVECDFISDKTRIIAHLDLTITLGRLLILGLRRGIHGIVEFQKVMNKRKGGVQT